MIRWYATGLVILLGSTLMPLSPALAHERKEVAGLSVLFGAEPEPALTEEVEWLRWRFQTSGTEQPFSDLEQAQATVTRAGKPFGPFEARAVRGQAGLLQTMHIFAEAGDYEVVLTFKKKGDPATHSIAFTYRIRDRAELRIP